MGRSAVALSAAECWELLATATLGRMTLSVQALPIILPVRYVVDDACVAIDIDRLGMPDATIRDSVVAFAVDDIDRSADEGWMVQVQGHARLTACGPDSVHPTKVLRLTPGTVTGLRYSVQPALPVP
jgi:uncharacterized protein